MKRLLLIVAGCFFTLLSFAQLRPDSIRKTGKGNSPAERYKKATPTNLPEGTYAKDNKVYIKQGYKGVYDASKKKVTIARMNSNGGAATAAINGSFVCSCWDSGTSTDGCSIVIAGEHLQCYSSQGKCKSCVLSVTIDKPQVVMQMVENSNHTNMNWKTIEISKMQQ